MMKHTANRASIWLATLRRLPLPALLALPLAAHAVDPDAPARKRAAPHQHAAPAAARASSHGDKQPGAIQRASNSAARGVDRADASVRHGLGEGSAGAWTKPREWGEAFGRKLSRDGSGHSQGPNRGPQADSP